MATTTAYGTALIGVSHNVNTTVSNHQWNPQAVSTPTGAVIFYADASTASGRILARRVDENGVPVGAEVNIATGTDSDSQRGFSVAKLSDGRIVIVWESSDDVSRIRFKIVSSDLSTSSGIWLAESYYDKSSHPDVAATADGGFVIVWEKYFSATDHDIAFRRFNANGDSSDSGNGISISSSTAYDEYPSVAVLNDGKFAFSFNRKIIATGNTESWHALYNTDGTVNKTASLFDSFGTENLKTDIIARADGGYIINYEDNVWSPPSRDIISARFSAAGVYQSEIRSSLGAGDNVMAASAASPDGYILVSHTHTSGNDMLGTLISPGGQRLFVDQQLVGDNGGPQRSGFGSVLWLDSSRVLITSIGDDGAPGDDGNGYGVASTVHWVQRTVTGDGADDVITLNTDGIRNVVNAGGGNDTVTLGAAADLVYGGAGDDIINGGAGNDRLFGGDGVDTLYGGDGDDYIEGGPGAFSTLVGGAGNDTIYGGAGNDYIVGDAGNDVLVGLGGQDSLYGGAGNDYIVAGDGVGSVLDGGAGANSLWGANGNDYMVGGQLADLIVGGGGSDYIFGNAGDDTIYGGQGTDYIYTNAGNDFVWTDDVGQPQSTDYIYVGGGTGVDTIADFTPGSGANHDVLVVSLGSGVTTFTQLMANTTQIGVYTVITLGADQVYLYNVQPFQLTEANTLFL